MSLDWDISKVVKKDDPEIRKYLSVMAHATMFVDLSGITEKNLEEWIWRVEFSRQLNTPFGHDHKGEPVYPTPQLLKDFVGLRTNVVTITRKQWLTRVMSGLTRKTDWAVKDKLRDLKELADANAG